MGEEFFERLRQRTIHKLLIQEGYDPIEDADVFEPHPDGWKGDVEEVDATIEALKEMMVGEPIEARARYDSEWGVIRLFDCKLGQQTLLTFGGDRTRSEKVTVMVFRDEDVQPSP